MFTRHTLNHSSNLPHDWFCSQGQHKHQSHESRVGQLEHVLVGNWPILTNNIKKISVRVELSITIPQDFSLLQWKCQLKGCQAEWFFKKGFFFYITNICKLIYARAFLLTPLCMNNLHLKGTVYKIIKKEPQSLRKALEKHEQKQFILPRICDISCPYFILKYDVSTDIKRMIMQICSCRKHQDIWEVFVTHELLTWGILVVVTERKQHCLK